MRRDLGFRPYESQMRFFFYTQGTWFIVGHVNASQILDFR